MFNDFEMKLDPTDNWDLKYLHVYHGIFISESENEYKKGKKIHIQEPRFEFVEEKTKHDAVYYVLIITGINQTAYIRANQKISLEYIIYNSSQKNERDFGRPMTFVPHLINVDSVLDENRVSNFKFNGLINLVVVALIVSHIRLIYDSFKKTGLLLTTDLVILQSSSIPYVAITAYMNIFAIVFCYLIERLAPILGSKKIMLINSLHILNLALLLSLPFILHFYKFYNPALGCLALTVTVIVFLKLFSFLHFWDDVRKFIYKRRKVEEERKKNEKVAEEDELSVIKKQNSLNRSMYEEFDQIIKEYPNNVKFSALLEFLILPVLCFQFKYPRTAQRRLGYIFTYALKVLICAFLQ